MNVYDFNVMTRQGEEISLSAYAGKVLLIVNTATECGFTPQYTELQEIYQEFHDRGLEILDFPCNQFGEQAPGSNAEIHSFCTGRFGITLPQFAKVEVTGEGITPLYRWLTDNGPFQGFDKTPIGLAMSAMLKKQDKNYKANNGIKWNFTKFLIDRNGCVVARYEPTTAMKKVKAGIEACL